MILPGLLDLHGHPEFNVFAAWEPPQLFATRYLWRGSPIYQAWSATAKTGSWRPGWAMRSCAMPRSGRWSAG